MSCSGSGGLLGPGSMRAIHPALRQRVESSNRTTSDPADAPAKLFRQALGRALQCATDAFVEAFTASVDFDQRLYRYDIQGSIAHATMLARQGILSHAERDAIVSGLETVRERIDAGAFEWSIPLEDVHMNVESALTELIGDAGKKLHTGRSRNDQVATDVRLWLRDEIDLIRAAIARLQAALLDLAEREPRPSCPASLICRSLNPSPLAITCWLGSRCWIAIASAWPIVVGA